jgi:hypothetical protein
MWIKLFNTGLPKNIILREIFGIIAVAAYFLVSGYYITKLWGQKLLSKMGAARYYLFVFLFLMMMSLPIKMYLRWFINLKYILAMSEFEFNI